MLFRNHFIPVLLPKETAAMNPKRFAAGSVPLDWCTNICADAWERQGGCGSDGRGRCSGGFLAPGRPGIQWGIPACVGSTKGCVLQAGVEVGVWWVKDPSGCHLIMPGGDLLVK